MRLTPTLTVGWSRGSSTSSRSSVAALAAEMRARTRRPSPPTRSRASACADSGVGVTVHGELVTPAITHGSVFTRCIPATHGAERKQPEGRAGRDRRTTRDLQYPGSCVVRRVVINFKAGPSCDAHNVMTRAAVSSAASQRARLALGYQKENAFEPRLHQGAAPGVYILAALVYPSSASIYPSSASISQQR